MLLVAEGSADGGGCLFFDLKPKKDIVNVVTVY